jgi:trehalose/maltose hydrolase-like predicted phosphorylase
MKRRQPLKVAAWRCLALGICCVAPLAHATTDRSFLLSASAQDFDNYFPGYLANGYVSTLTAQRGTEGNLGYMVAFMDYAKDDMSRPAAVPGWTEIDYSTGKSSAGQFWLNQVGLDPATFQDYSQVLNLHDATLTTSYRYLDHGRSTDIKVTTFVSEAAPHLAATQLSITPDFDGTVQLSFALNLWAPYQPRLPLGKMTGEEMQEAVAAHNMKLIAIPPATPDRAPVWYHGTTNLLGDDGDAQDLTLWLDGQAEQGLKMAEAAAIELPQGSKQAREVKLYKSQYRLALDVTIDVTKGKTYTFTKYVAMSREGWGGDAKADLALARSARTGGFAKLLREHQAAWHALWQSDIVVDGDIKAQRAVHSDLYYVLATSTVDTAWAMGACALTPGYVGHVFWDSDTWMFPALLLLHPERAKPLVMFRTHTLAAAQQRAHERGFKGAMYPWEADPENGSEQTPHFAHVLGEREIHVNADIAIAQWQYWLATHDRQWLREDGWPVIRNIAEFWASRATYNAEKQRYEIVHVTSVEEDYNDVPNDTYTNVSAAKALRIATAAAALVGDKPDPRWADIAARIYMPFSAAEQRHLDFDESVPHDHGHSDLTFLAYPSLDVAMSEQVRRNDYVTAVKPMPSEHTPNTMGLAPISIAAAALGDAAEAARWAERNIADDMFKPPFNVRSETASNNSGYFITGSAGFLQSLIYGFSGLRIDDKGLVEAYAPVLPPDWKSLTLKNITFRGKRYDLTIDRDAKGRAKLTRKGK